jgi:anti-sigma regulatory factor (Ser/Thr protein kinase)
MSTLTSTNTTQSDRDRLVLLGAEHAALLAAARAVFASIERGEADPLGYLRDHLAARGQLPAAGARPSQLLAAGRVPESSTAVHEQTFAGRAESVREVRGFVTRVLAGCPRADDAVLCASELATNALMHSASGQAGGCFTVQLQVCGQVCVRITVADQGVRAHHQNVPAQSPSVPARPAQGPARISHGAAHGPAPTPPPSHAPLTRPAGEGGYGLPVVRAMVGGEPGGTGLSFTCTPNGGVASCTLAWPVPERQAGL